jgi:TonB-dependent receptor
MKNFIILFVFSLFSTALTAQEGFIRGTISTEEGDVAPYTTIQIVETATGVSTDLDGKYSITIDEGSYTLKASYVGYNDTEIKNVVVKAGETTIVDIVLTTDAVVVDVVQIEAKAITNTDAAVNTIKSKAAIPIDGISNKTLRAIGGSKASDVVKAIPGVSIQGGKYVFVRGLGDRYTKSILNGMDIPGLDPDRNTLQMDIFPSNIIENIFVYKAFSPDLPADFAGGVVNLVTKEFPDEKTFDVSFGLGFNPAMHFNPDALSATGSSTDFLGFDNGLRNLPVDKNAILPDPANTQTNPATGQPYNADLQSITESFNSNLGAVNKMSPMNFNLSVSTGNQFKKEDSKFTFGYNAALNYRNNTTFYDEVEFNAFMKNDDVSVLELDANRLQKGALSSNNVLLSAMLGGAMKWGNEKLSHKLSANILQIQNGESTNGDFMSETIIDNSVTLSRNNVEYTERSITNAYLKGVHSINQGDINIEWKVAPTISSIYDKDVRVTPLRLDEDEYSIEPSEGAIPERFWRNLEEENLASRLDITKKISMLGNKSKIKIGVSNTYKHRDYEILSYRTNVDGQNNLQNSFLVDGDANKILSAENIWNTTTEVGTYMKGNFEPTNTYDASQNVLGAYLMGDLVFSSKFRAIIGARMEMFDQTYSGQNNLGTTVYDNERILDELNILPSVNLVYTLMENKNRGTTMNVRGGYSKTLARPSFKEASIAEIFDAISGRTFIGNINLVQTQIDNIDFRWEYFMPSGQIFSVSAFYKKFVNPIELVAYDIASPNNFQPRNVGDAQVLGLEIEARKDFSFISPAWKPLSLGANITLVDASVTMDEVTYESRVAAARDGEVVENTRAMQGQSPYIINGFLNYSNRETGLEGNLNYNVQGPSLFLVGINTNPDVYQKSFHNLNIKVSKRFGNTADKEGKHKVSFRVQNILGQEQQKVYQSFGATEQLFELFAPARTFSVSYALSL